MAPDSLPTREGTSLPPPPTFLFKGDTTLPKCLNSAYLCISLMNLAKYPASTLQILGAEKALFRALKAKHETPKYGLIFHASLVGQAGVKNKGKISRVLAAKSALACRYDAFGEKMDTTCGLEGRATVEARLRSLEGVKKLAPSKSKPSVYDYNRSLENPSFVRYDLRFSTVLRYGYISDARQNIFHV